MTPRTLVALLLVAVAGISWAGAAQPLGAQQQDSAQAGVSRNRRPPGHRDSVPKPPIPPGRSFLYSLLVPGLGQAKLDRPTLAVFFFTIEVVSIVQARQAAI